MIRISTVQLAAGLAGALVLAEYVRRRRAGRDPLGVPPTGELPDTTLALVAAFILYFAVSWGIGTLLSGTELFRLGGDSVIATANGLTHAAFGIVLLHPATRGPRRATLSDARIAVAGVLAGLAAFTLSGVVAIAIEIIVTWTKSAMPIQDVVTQARSAGSGEVLVFALTAVVVAPFAEEVFFRGILYPALANAMPRQVALVLQALIFGAIHITRPEIWPLAIPLALVGWCAGWLYTRTGSLGAPMVLHLTFNAVNFAALRGA